MSPKRYRDYCYEVVHVDLRALGVPGTDGRVIVRDVPDDVELLAEAI